MPRQVHETPSDEEKGLSEEAGKEKKNENEKRTTIKTHQDG